MTAIVDKFKNFNLKESALKLKETMLDFPLFILASPFKGFDEMKTYNRGSMLYAIIILVIYGMVNIWWVGGMGFVATGFHSDVSLVNVPWTLMFTFAPIVLISVANWSITSITEGKGKLKEIFQVYCYALFPAIVCYMIGITLSNFVTTNEINFVWFFLGFGQIVMYFYLFLGLLVIHEFTFLKAILMVLLTVLAMLIIVFVIVLFVSLLSDLISFIITVFNEAEAHWL